MTNDKKQQIKNKSAILAIVWIAGIAFGAFGAHALKQTLSADSLETWKTGQLYHMFGAFALSFFYLQMKHSSAKDFAWSWRFTLGGIVLFSGSLYLLACKEFLDLPWSLIGPFTPIGGLLLMLAWLFFYRQISKDLH